MDALASVLRSLRLKSAILSLARLTGSFGVGSNGIARTMIFHGVVAGRCFVRAEHEHTNDAIELVAGDVVLLTRGDAHRVTSAPGAHAIPIAQLSMKKDAGSGVPVLTYGPPGEETRIVCGTFVLDHPAAASVVGLMPRVLGARPSDATRRRWALATLELLEQEAATRGSTSSQATSLADSLFVHLLTEIATDGHASHTVRGLLAAARDAHVGRALALIHDDPARSWTIDDLASRAGMSRSRFFERFTALVGEPPAKYLARWRVLAAADLVRDESLSTLEIAEKVGYSSEDSLARAFKRHLGVSIGEYRRRGDPALLS